MTPPLLLAVPNVSEGREGETIEAIGRAFARTRSASARHGRAERGEDRSRVRLLDVHSDADHHRSVFTLAALQGRLVDALLAGARETVRRVDVMSRATLGAALGGQHPHVGALDVAPVVYLHAGARGAACAEALVLADRIGSELDVPVLLYGELTRGADGSERTRAELRRGGAAALAARMSAGERRGALPTQPQSSDPGQALSGPPLSSDFGPSLPHPTAGVTLVAAREPLVAFNVQLAGPATLADARAIAALVREGGAEGLPGVRAMGVSLGSGLAQVSMNVERPLELSLGDVVRAVARHARVVSAELVGLAPRAALEGFPGEVPMPGFDPARHLIENALDDLRC